MFEPLSYYLIPAGLLVLAAPLLLRRSSSTDKQHRQLLLDTASPSTPAMPHTVVILGAGVAGVPLAHHLLKHTPAGVTDLRVVLVSPNTHLLWPFATVRAILPDQLADDKILLPLAPAFAAYGTKRFTHVVGTAVRVDPDAHHVAVAPVTTTDTPAPEEIVQPYDTLVIATGSSFREGMPFKNRTDTPETRAALHAWQAAVRDADDIVVAGAGLTGVEVAGELGQQYALPGKKTITLIADDDQVLYPAVLDKVRRAAARELSALGVRILTKTRVVAAATPTTTTTTPGAKKPKTTLTLRGRDGTTTTRTTDLYLPTVGITTNTGFLPPAMLAADGRVAVRSTLQTVAHADVFALGDVADAQAPTGMNAEGQVVFLAAALQTYLATRGAKAAAAAAPPLPEYKASGMTTWGITVGPKRGTGQAGSWKIWGFLIAYIKGRNLGTDYAPDFVAGTRTLQQKSW